MLGNYQEETKAGANLKTKRASTLILANSKRHWLRVQVKGTASSLNN